MILFITVKAHPDQIRIHPGKIRLCIGRYCAGIKTDLLCKNDQIVNIKDRGSVFINSSADPPFRSPGIFRSANRLSPKRWLAAFKIHEAAAHTIGVLKLLLDLLIGFLHGAGMSHLEAVLAFQIAVIRDKQNRLKRSVLF